MNTAIGQPVSRLDGCAKVTGAARYTADTVIGGRAACGASAVHDPQRNG